MSPPPEHDRRGFEPAKARWLTAVGAALLGLMQAEEIWRRSGGDWSRIVRAVPATLALMAAFLGGFFLLGFLIEWARTRRWPRFEPERPKSGFGWLVRVGGVGLFFLYAMRWCVDDTPWTSPGDGLAKTFSHFADDWVGAAVLGAFLLFVLAINWWLGFSERDNARALERDRQSRLHQGEPS